MEGGGVVKEGAGWIATFDMSGGPKGAKRPLERPLDGNAKDFPPSGNGDKAPRLVVFKVINLKPLKGEGRGFLERFHTEAIVSDIRSVLL